MWMLDNHTAYEVERTWIRDKDGAHHWIVVVKATFDISVDGRLILADQQVEPLHAPVYNGVDGESSLRYEADLVAMKPATDVYLNAIAHAPDGRPTTKLKVSFQIDRLRKELVVYGDRIWQHSLTGGLKPSHAEPFLTMPVNYDRAFGGYDQVDPDPRKHRIDFRNPVGTGVAYSNDHIVGSPAPNIEDSAGKLGQGWPAGFGAIASYWSPRRELGGTYDEEWTARRRPLLPEDYNPRCLLCAPLDQQMPGYLKGRNRIAMINLTSGGRLQFTLPKVAFHFETYFGTACRRHAAELVSVIVESEGPRLILVWQTSLPCGNDGDYLDVTVIRQKDHG